MVIKNPATNAARKTRPTQGLSLRPEVYEVVGHMKHPVFHLPIRMLTWWMNASHLSHQLGQICRCGEEPVPCWGGNTAQQAARYNPHLEEAGVWGFSDQLRDDDPPRRQGLRKVLHRRIVSKGLAAEIAMIRGHSRLTGRAPERRQQAYLILAEVLSSTSLESR